MLVDSPVTFYNYHYIVFDTTCGAATTLVAISRTLENHSIVIVSVSQMKNHYLLNFYFVHPVWGHRLVVQLNGKLQLHPMLQFVELFEILSCPWNFFKFSNTHNTFQTCLSPLRVSFLQVLVLAFASPALTQNQISKQTPHAAIINIITFSYFA